MNFLRSWSLERKLRSPDTAIRLAAVKELQGSIEPTAIPFLATALRDKSDEVANAAILVLGERRTAEALNALNGFLKELLLSRLMPVREGDGNDLRLSNMVRAFEKFGPAAADPLISILDNRDAEMAVKGSPLGTWGANYAAQLLGTMLMPRAISALERRLNDSDAHIRGWSASSLGQPGNRSFAMHLCELLKDREEFVREKAVEALGRIGDPGALNYLTPLLEDSQWRVVQTAAKTLETLSWRPGSSRHKALLAAGLGRFDQAAEEGAAAIMPILRSIWHQYGIQRFDERNYAMLTRQLTNVMKKTKLDRLPSDYEIEPAVKALRQISSLPGNSEQEANLLRNMPVLDVRGMGRSERYDAGSDLYSEVDEPVRRTISL